MDEQLKRRLIGAIVLVSLAIIFLPMLLEHEPEGLKPTPMKPLPEEPPRQFDSSLLQDIPPETATTPEAPKAVQPRADTPAVEPAPASTEKPRTAKAPAKPAPKPVPKPTAKAGKPTGAGKSSPSGWVVQVASLSNRESATKLVKKLRRAGLDTMEPRAVTVKGKRFYRVQVGPEISRENAEKHLALIKRVTGAKGQVMRYP